MNRLAELMEAQGVAVKQMAHLAGIPERTVYRHYRKQTQIDLPQAAAYAKALRIKIEDLVAA